MSELTDIQNVVLRTLAFEKSISRRGMSAREVARAVWPLDPGWSKRTAGNGANRHNGAMGATMPLRAGRVLAKLRDLGLAEDDDRKWSISFAGYEYLKARGENITTDNIKAWNV